MTYSYTCPSCGLELDIPINLLAEEYYIPDTFNLACEVCKQELDEWAILEEYMKTL